MQRPRVIVHAGFHKTGTTTAQKFLRANGKHIYPRCALVLPGRLRNSAARMAVRYSRFGTAAILDGFARELHETLIAIHRRDRAVLICDENLAGRMPGRDGQAGYHATPALMARAESVICDVFGADADVVFHFTTRAPEDWLRSVYRHTLRTSRQMLDEAEFIDTFGAAADLARVATDVATAVNGAVQTVDLADLDEISGPAQALIDLIKLPAHLCRRLQPHPAMNAGPPDSVIDELLALNRSALSDEALFAAKAQLLGKEQTDD